MTKKKLILAITGASGAIYAKQILDNLTKLTDQIEQVGVVMSANAQQVWQHELGNTDFRNYSFPFYEKDDFSAPFASGSAKYDTMIVVPCSMGTMARIAQGISNDLVTRSADVILKERRKLILVTRETPLNLIHINNMKAITECGGIICPASPSYYSQPSHIEALAKTVTDRVLDLVGFNITTYRWNE